MVNKHIRFSLTMLVFALATPAAHAQFAVIDVASLTQLVSEVQTLEQQLATARSQLSAAQAEFQAITGGRGMEQLLAGTARNYLPADWATLTGSASSYPALRDDMQQALAATSVLSATQLAALPAAAASQLAAQRHSAALLQTVAHAALANASGRFAALQQLIDAIGSAQDQKAALDLQARIGAEGGMLENEHTKLETLYQGVAAEEKVNAQRGRELALSGHGQFDSRFRPQP